VAFLPFGLLIDQWRWQVFSGAVTPANYNRAWWDLRPSTRASPAGGAHRGGLRPGRQVPRAGQHAVHALLPRARAQFQFYRALCREAGHTGPLYRCSFFDSKQAGAKLATMLEAGQSKPWSETLYATTGERQMDAGAMMEYFAPLKAWLDQQNKGRPVGWTASR
jgi:peptidyl-dipeptidase A